MGKRFTFKGKDYRVDDDGDIYEDEFLGAKVGEMEDDGTFTIKTGVFSEEKGRIPIFTDDIIETDFFGDKDKAGEKKSDCFLTTACVEYAGLPDDCPQLKAMREFRDEYVSALPQGPALLEDYYRTAPVIVREIGSGEDADIVFEGLLRSLKSVVSLIEAGETEKAYAICEREFNRLKERYIVRE